MNDIEITAYYKDASNTFNHKANLIGSITAKIKLLDLEIKFIQAWKHKKKDKFYFFLPRKMGKLHNGEKCMVEVVSFSDKERDKNFKKVLFEECEKYIRALEGEHESTDDRNQDM